MATGQWWRAAFTEPRWGGPRLIDASLDADQQPRLWGISGFSVINLWLMGSLKWNYAQDQRRAASSCHEKIAMDPSAVSCCSVVECCFSLARLYCPVFQLKDRENQGEQIDRYFL